MSQCSIDHTQQDVDNKLGSQRDYLPESLFIKVQQFSASNISQEKRNELFHLLKKYDLAPTEEQEKRNEQLHQLVK